MKLIFHVGAGKTGTSSIQAALRRSREILEAKGLCYLGMNLEEYAPKMHRWQAPRATPLLLKLPQKEASEQISSVLLAASKLATEQGINSMIWSSEWFFRQSEKPLEALRNLKKNHGWDINIVAYVRRHDYWVRSAYLQWAIKHKTYRGPLKSFADWVEGYQPEFFSFIKAYEDSFPGDVILRNYESVDNVVSDFFDILNISRKKAQEHSNVTGDGVEIFMRAVLNNSLSSVVSPVVFDEILGRYSRFQPAGNGEASSNGGVSAPLERGDRESLLLQVSSLSMLNLRRIDVMKKLVADVSEGSLPAKKTKF